MNNSILHKTTVVARLCLLWAQGPDWASGSPILSPRGLRSMCRPALTSLLPETTQDPLSWAYYYRCWGAPKSVPRPLGPSCSLWQAMALSILRVFLLISWKQASINSMERLQAQGIFWTPQHLPKSLEPSNLSATWPKLPPCPGEGQDHDWQASLILKMHSRGH